MAYREVTMVEIKEVLRRWLLGTGKKEIARQVGLDRNTVRRYIRAAEQCGIKEIAPEALSDELLGEVLVALDGIPGRRRGESWDRCAAQRGFVEEKLGQGIRLSKVRKLLLRRGVNVPYPTLHRFAVAELGFGRRAPTIPVADGEPGEELQVDTGRMGYLEPNEEGKRKRFRAWIFTAVRSRHRFVYPTFGEKTEDAIEACEAAWEFFGGIFRVLVPDNTKAIVDKADPLAPTFNETFLEYSQARGFVIDPTRIRSPKDKARVERSVVPTREDCFAGEVLRSLEEARERGRVWCLDEYGMRRHTRTQRFPLELFLEEEKGRLLAAPTEPYDVPEWSSPKVAPDQHAQVAKAIYSLPRVYIGQRLRARADRSVVRFYDKRVLVKAHPRKPPGGRSTDVADFPPEQAAYAMRDVEFLRRQAASKGTSIKAFTESLLAGPEPWLRMRRVYALLGLCRRYGKHRVEDACQQAVAEDMYDIRRLERMLKQAVPPDSTRAVARTLPFPRYLRPVQAYAIKKTKGDSQ